MKKALIIGTVWPEPNSSAAGSRMLQIIDLLKVNNWVVDFACTANTSDFSYNLNDISVSTHSIQLNSSMFDNFIKDLNPDIVIFDRFTIEEQFGWRVAENCPNALRVLDTEDLHCLRKTRELAVKKNENFSIDLLLENEVTKRELASIYRCDISLIISSFEMNLLTKDLKIDDSLLFYLPFLIDEKTIQKNNLPRYQERTDFITIGNFLHPPNWDSIQYLKKEIWPLIRKELPYVKMNIYGAYPSEKNKQLHHEKDGFLIHGRAENVSDVMRKAKVCLAPLRFGAGLKGKLLDAMLNGLPSVTTSVGAEGMGASENWCGFVEDNPTEFAKKAIELCQSENVWQNKVQEIQPLLSQFNKDKYELKFIEKINFTLTNLDKHRKENIIGQLLQHHTLQSTKYLSKWIEAKNA